MPGFDSYVAALLHMDGTDASTTFIDETGKTWTANGNAQIDTALSVFGGASGLFDGTGDYLSTSDHSDFDFGSGDFTIDLRVQFNATPGVACHFFGQTTDVNNRINFLLWNNSGLKLYFRAFSGGSTIIDVNVSWTPSVGVWYHLAVVRSGSSLYFFVNGTQQGATQTVSGTLPNLASSPRIGSYDGSSDFLNGWLDEVRISKGIARWTANFTPATEAYSGPSQAGILIF